MVDRDKAGLVLLGQGRLKCYDALLNLIAASHQRAGRRPRDRNRYRALVAGMRGLLRTERLGAS